MPYKDPIKRAVKGLERSRKYRELRPERVKENARANYQKRKPEMIAKTKKYQDENREKYLLSKKITHLKCLYGISLDDFNKMVAKQKGVCIICKGLNRSNKKLFVDHCYKTGKIRGLLCSGCNFAIGLMRDDIKLLEKAIKYLK